MTKNINCAVPFYKIIAIADETNPWITMVHGASQNSAVFSAQVQAFQSDYRLLLIDLPGHGKSAALAGPYGLEEHAAAVLAAIDDAGLDKTHFWGTHTGAGVGLLLAARHGNRFECMMLEGVVLPGVELPSVAHALGRARTTARIHGVDAARIEWFKTADWFAVMREKREQCRAAQHWSIIAEFAGGPWLDCAIAKTVPSILDIIPKISMPVLLINGEHDLPDFMRTAAELADKLPNCERAIIPDAGGFPLWEFPRAVNDCVRRFLDHSERKELP